jgi:hypothetical protein
MIIARSLLGTRHFRILFVSTLTYLGRTPRLLIVLYNGILLVIKTVILYVYK